MKMNLSCLINNLFSHHPGATLRALLIALALFGICISRLPVAFMLADKIDAGAVVRHAPDINGQVQGTVRQLTGEDVSLSGNASITGELLVPGTPTVEKYGNPTVGGILQGKGNAQPSGYKVKLDGNVDLGYLITRTDPIPLPSVANPPSSTGNRDVTVNNGTDPIGDFATLRDLTLNGNAGLIAVPPGNYRDFKASSGTGFVFGIAGSTQPAVYNFNDLKLDGRSDLQLLGPAIITLANGLTINGTAGSPNNPLWL